MTEVTEHAEISKSHSFAIVLQTFLHTGYANDIVSNLLRE